MKKNSGRKGPQAKAGGGGAIAGIVNFSHSLMVYHFSAEAHTEDFFLSYATRMNVHLNQQYRHCCLRFF